MTEQIATLVRLDGAEWTLTASTSALFDIDDLDLHLEFVSTACWDGYVETFAIADGKLVLAELHANDRRRPVLFGVRPIEDPRGDFAAVYLGLNHQLTFNGAILLGRSRCRSRYGWYRDFEWAELREVFVDRGVVARIVDRSSEATRLLQTLLALQPPKLPPPDQRWAAHEREADELAHHARDTFYWKYFEPRYKHVLRRRSPQGSWVPTSKMDRVHVFTAREPFATIEGASAAFRRECPNASAARVEIVHRPERTKLFELLRPAPFSVQWRARFVGHPSRPKKKANAAVCVYEPPRLSLASTPSWAYEGAFFYAPDGPNDDD